MRTPTQRMIPWLAASVAVLIVAGLLGAVASSGGSTRTITAQFAEAPGIYPGNHVDILGIPVGSVTSIKPGPDYVLVKMSVRSDVKIPAGAGAVIMAPTVVADRFVQLLPAYQGGPTMASGTVIPVNRTAIPQSVDLVVQALTRLADQLGPNGANKNGALSQLLHQMAVQFGNDGPDFNAAVVNFSQALHGFAQNAPQVAGVLNNLGSLSHALATHASTYQSFAADLASVSSILAGDRTDISAVLTALQQLFANLNSFLQADGSKLGNSISNLRTFAGALVSQQAALAKVFDLSPLSLQNLDNAIDKNAPGGPALRGRYDAVGSTQQLFNQVCGNAALRFLVILATGTQTNPLTVATPVDTLCGIGNAINALTPPPGASAGPNLSLQALAG
ncbi:MAG TPA: MCE family protein [Acidimicrobiales bacterium]|nr:MCE family protein [Acidimicrobiales bacterium]